MRAILPFAMLRDPYEEIDNIVDNGGFIDEIRNECDENLSDFIYASRYDGATINFEDGVRDYAESCLYKLVKDAFGEAEFSVVELINNSTAVVEIPDEEFLFKFFEDANQSKEQDIVEFLENDTIIDIYGELAENYLQLVNSKGNVNSELDKEIQDELLSIDFSKLSEELVGALICFMAYDNQPYSRSVYSYFDESLVYDGDEIFFTGGGWDNYVDFSPLVKMLNDCFKFKPILTDLEQLPEYKFNGKEYTKAKMESFKVVANKLKRFLGE